jgi:hypothetical protein
MADTKMAAVQAKLQTQSRDFQKLEAGGCAPRVLGQGRLTGRDGECD